MIRGLDINSQELRQESRRATKAWYFLLLTLAALIWAGQGTAVKVLEPHLGPVAITFLPFYVATALLFPLLLRIRHTRSNARRLRWSDWRKFIVAGIGGQMAAQFGMTWGVTKSLASNAAILNLLIPVISAVLACALLQERLTRLRVASLFLGLAGVFLLSAGDLRSSSFIRSNYLVGNLLILAGCLGSSFYNVYCKELLRRFEEVEILIFSYITACIASLPLLIWLEPFHLRTLISLDARSWLAFAFLAVLMYGASMLLFFEALKHLDVTVASTSLYLVPVFGVLLAFAIIGERLSPIALFGAVIVIAATVVIMKYDTAA